MDKNGNMFDLPVLDGIVSYKEKGSGYFCEGHRHNFYELFYVDRGPLNVVLDGAGFPGDTGDLFVFFPSQEHLIWSEKTAPNIINLHFRFSRGHCRYPGISRLRNGPVRVSSVMRDVISRILDASRLRTSAGSILTRLYLAEILLLAVEAPNTGAAKISRRIVENGKKKLVGIVEEHMIRNMASCIRARDIARAVGVSESTLRHAFKQTTGTTVADRLAEIRITRAKDLLRESDLSITGISDRVGYPSIHSFSRAFKRLVGMTPCEYSRSIGSGPNRPIAGNDKKNAVPAKDNPSCV